MRHTTTTSNGFSIIEVIIVLGIIGIIGLIGWNEYEAHQPSTVASKSSAGPSTNKPATSATSAPATPQIGTTAPASSFGGPTKMFTDPSGSVTLSYPASWTTGTAAPGDTTPAALLDPSVMTFVPPNAPAYSKQSNAPNAVSVYAYRTSDSQAVLTYIQSGDTQTGTAEFKINGANATYQQSVSSSYTDDYYVVTHNNTTVLIVFREKQAPPAGDDTMTSFDAASATPAFNAIAQSLKFLK